MPPDIRAFNADVTRALDDATRCNKAVDAGLRELRDACAAGRWCEIDGIREKIIVAVDGYVDNYTTACRRLELEVTKQ